MTLTGHRTPAGELYSPFCFFEIEVFHFRKIPVILQVGHYGRIVGGGVVYILAKSKHKNAYCLLHVQLFK